MLMQINGLKKEYITGEVITKVLHNLTFNIGKGEFVSIMGPSGSGKSTLMHILGLLERTTDGKYFLDGKNTTNMDDDELALLRNEKIGFVFQSFNLLPRVNLVENVRLPLVYAKDKKNSRKKAIESLEKVGLAHRLAFMPNQISGGEKQRVAIARALVNNPSIIFADEPTGNLDSKSGIKIMETLQELNEQGNTIILVTHETFTAEHAKRIIMLHDGLIVNDYPIINRRFAHDGNILK
jgi:putative ABC transport system ATP-binding protein